MPLYAAREIRSSHRRGHGRPGCAPTRGLPLATLVLLALGACAETVADLPLDRGPDDRVEPRIRCVPGEPVYCRCDDGAAGSAACLDHGHRGACQCAPATPSREFSAEPEAISIDPSRHCAGPEGGCFTEASDTPLCPCARPRHDLTRPAWRVTGLRFVAPTPLRASPVGELLARAVRDGSALLGLDADLSRRFARLGRLDRRRFRRGRVGLGLLDARFGFFAGDAEVDEPHRYDPMVTLIALSPNDFGSTETHPRWDLPIAATDGGAARDLTLCNLRLARVPLDATAGCIGRAVPHAGTFDECRATWDPTDGAEISATITVTTARQVVVDAEGRTLCEVLAGTHCGSSMSQWRNRPDAYACDDSAWRVSLRLAAVAANIDR